MPHPQEEEMPGAPANAEAPADAEERPAPPPPPPHRVRQRRTSSLPTRSPTQSASCRRLSSRWTLVPFVNRPFESEIHGTVNFTYFCCFLLVTWCHCVLLSCYLRPK